ncbi:alpha/beta hydrolase family protein [Actinoplanes teichomyceticus]|uniref:Putative alpha/beta hydrolase n=1 Tax=Actinoplanes teichomyceticus TaxID=1867 RepID=A0A561WJY4_ACTTI|nr:alpha/beta hydrolase [Actinoplanes teichomyceticus]TWG24143.1 putative alpha/beta hydrolase [Actinoplanes teichomyceticus]GIF13012.1 alpha/beta hydrolase [Actinoplanes teichomyceticus]
MRNTETARIPVPTGGAITATLFTPETPAAVAVVHPATATPQGFYASFAGYLAGNGIATVTYDYRGTGRSGHPRKHRDLGMRDWIGADAPAVAAWAGQRFAGLPRLALGHSLGGHVLALGAGGTDLAASVIIASHVAALRTIPSRRERARVRLMLHLVGPALGRVLGYVPARRLGLGEDLPAAAMAEWGGWTRLDNYFFDDPTMRARERAATVTGPVLAVGASDDPWSTPPQMDALTGYLTAAGVQRRTYTPAGAGVPVIGHHGLLRRSMRDTVWPELLAWLRAHAAKASR